MTRLAFASVAGFLAVAIAAPAALGRDGKPAGQAGVLQDVLACRSITDSTQRLACFDAASAKMAEAESSGQVVVVDRDQAREVRRQAFGFNLPSLSFFKGSKEPELEEVTVKLKSASQSLRGKWRFVTEDGAIWDQIDDAVLNKPAHAGSTAVISKGALGSFKIKVDGQLSLKVHRTQ